jgi:hypothetical protein
MVQSTTDVASISAAETRLREFARAASDLAEFDGEYFGLATDIIAEYVSGCDHDSTDDLANKIHFLALLAREVKHEISVLLGDPENDQD